MLKITYTENGSHLEYLTESVSTWRAKRILVCLRAAVSIHVESVTAGLMLPVTFRHLKDLQALEAENEIVELNYCDDEYIEIVLAGIWVASHQDSEEGVFVCELNDDLAIFLYKLWQESQIGASVMSE